MAYYRDDGRQNWSGGVLVGLVLGALAGLFLSPKSGKENREDLMNKLNDMRDRGSDFYNKARDEMDTRMKDIKGNIDESKYMALMKDVMSDLKAGAMATADEMGKTRERLMADFRRMSRSTGLNDNSQNETSDVSVKKKQPSLTRRQDNTDS